MMPDGVLRAVYPRHEPVHCAHCNKLITEINMMYTRDGKMYFCDPSHDKQHWEKDRQAGAGK